MGKKLTVDMIPEGYNFAAVDGNGFAYAYVESPKIGGGSVWYCSDAQCIFIWHGFDATNWKNSLIFKHNNMDLQQIEKQIAELSAKLEDLKKQAEEKDFPKSINQLLDQDRYHVGCDGEIEKILPGRPDFDDLPTRQHAVSQRAASQLMNLIYHINGGQIVEMGVSVGYNKIDGFFVAATVNVVNPFVKFKNIELARRSIELHRRLWMEYFTGQEQPEE